MTVMQPCGPNRCYSSGQHIPFPNSSLLSVANGIVRPSIVAPGSVSSSGVHKGLRHRHFFNIDAEARVFSPRVSRNLPLPPNSQQNPCDAFSLIVLRDPSRLLELIFQLRTAVLPSIFDFNFQLQLIDIPLTQ